MRHMVTLPTGLPRTRPRCWNDCQILGQGDAAHPHLGGQLRAGHAGLGSAQRIHQAAAHLLLAVPVSHGPDGACAVKKRRRGTTRPDGPKSPRRNGARRPPSGHMRPGRAVRARRPIPGKVSSRRMKYSMRRQRTAPDNAPLPIARRPTGCAAGLSAFGPRRRISQACGAGRTITGRMPAGHAPLSPNTPPENTEDGPPVGLAC